MNEAAATVEGCVDPTLVSNIALSTLSFLLAAISIVFVVLTIRQNSKMIEASTRAYIGVSSALVNNGTPLLELIVRNFGSSAGIVCSFQPSISLADYTLDPQGMSPFEGIEGTSLMPGQSLFTGVDYKKLDSDGISDIMFDVVYESNGKIYEERSVVGIRANSALVHARVCEGGGSELRTIAYALQGIVERMT